MLKTWKKKKKWYIIPAINRNASSFMITFVKWLSINPFKNPLIVPQWNFHSIIITKQFFRQYILLVRKVLLGKKKKKKKKNFLFPKLISYFISFHMLFSVIYSLRNKTQWYVTCSQWWMCEVCLYQWNISSENFIICSILVNIYFFFFLL